MPSPILPENYIPGAVFLGAVALAVVLVPLSGLFARALGALDTPDERKVHKKTVSRLGGLGMALSLVAVLVLTLGVQDRTVRAFLLGAGFVVFTGLMDDTRGLSHRMKFLGEILAALAFLVTGGFYLQSFGNLLGFGEITTGPPWLGIIITVFCMVGVMNAINLSDGLDGLAAGLCFIAALFMAVLSYESQAGVWMVISLALLGALLGFLRYNHYPANLFMGDSGSLLLGYSMAAVAVGLAQRGAAYQPVEPVVLGTLLALPILDTLRVMITRKLAGRHPFRPDQMHFHHRLLKLGLLHRETVDVLYLLMFALGCFAWFGRGLPEWTRFTAVIALFVSVYTAMYILEYYNLSLRKRLIKFRRSRRCVVKTPDSRTMTWIFGAMGGILLLLLLAPLAAVKQLPENMGPPLAGSALLIGILYPWRGKRKQLLMGFGVLYAACFILLFFYLLIPDKPIWVLTVLHGTGGVSLLLLLAYMAVYRSKAIPLPTGLELLLFLASWSVPLIVLPAMGADTYLQFNAAMACTTALVMLFFFKLLLRRRSLPNNAVAGSLAFIFLLLALMAVFL